MILAILFVLIFGGYADAATRLGLHVTAEERAVWQARMTDNVNTINGFTYQSIYQNRILADANSFKAQSHPGGDGWWAGYTGSGCVPLNDQTVKPGSGGTGYGRGNGAWMMRSAFTFMLTGDTSYANPVRTEFLSLIAQSGLAWSNTSKWCYQQLGGGNFLEILPWLVRLMLSYDYLIAGGYTGFSEAEKTSIKDWLEDAAIVFDNAHVYIIQTTSGFYPGIYNTPQSLACVSCSPGTLAGPLYFGGPNSYFATYFTFYNQFVHGVVLSMGMGLINNNTTLINHAVAFATAFIKAGIYDNGSVADFRRWADCDPECPRSMWDHTFAAVGGLTATIDMYARNGDTSLYTLTAPSGAIGQSGSTVGFFTTVRLLADMANNTVQLYGTTSSGEQDNAHRLSWNTQGHVYTDFSTMVANMFYDDSAIDTAMSRNTLGTNTNTTLGCTDNQYGGCFSGAYSGMWADLPFMFGNMKDNAANPYLDGEPEPPPSGSGQLELRVIRKLQ